MPSEFLRLKASMPVLGVGIGLRGEICNETIANKNEIDFLEFTPENYRENNATIGWLSSFAQHFALVTHSVSLSIGSIDPLDRNLLKITRSFMKRFHLKWWSDHLCFTGVDGVNGNDLFPLPWTEEAVKHVARRVKEAQETVEFPLILENIPFYTRMPQGDFDEADFIKATLEEADCGMLLDLNNLFVNSINHGFDPKKYLDRLPLERVVQIHLAGPGKFGKRTIDTHGAAVPQPVFELLDYALSKNIGAKAVMIERDQFFPKFDEMLEEVRHVRSIWDKHNKPIDNALQQVAGKSGGKIGSAENGSRAGSSEQDSQMDAFTNDGDKAATEVDDAGSYTSVAPPPAVAEMAALSMAQPELVKSNNSETAGASLSGRAVDKSIQLHGLANFERRWMELWTELIGTDPVIVDSKSFKPKFAHTPSGIDGFDLKALSVYTWLRDSNRDSLMRGVYPATFQLLKKDWLVLLAEFFYKFRPQYKDNRTIGDRFPEFMKQHGLRYQAEYPYLFELVEYEQLRHLAGRTHELTDFSGDVYLGSTEQIKSFRPLVNPELTIRSFIYPVLDIAAALIANQESFHAYPLDVPVIFALLPQSWASKVVRLSGLSMKMIDMARTGNRSYSQLIASLMTDEQRQSPEAIASFIQLFQVLHQEKIFIGCIPVEFREGSWAGYCKAVSEQKPHQTILTSLRLFADSQQEPGLAVDLGCGSGRDAKEMLRQGWRVFAVDRSEDALEILRAASDGWEDEQLTTHLGAMQDVPIPSADLINAGISLPFCPPDKFDKLWKNIRTALKPGGRFSGHFFGVNDDWAVNKKMTFHTAEHMKKFFEGFELEYYNEMEGPIPIVPSGIRHGHLFEVVARKL